MRRAARFVPITKIVTFLQRGPAAYLALADLWVLTVIGYLLGPETRGTELEELTDEALAENLASV